MRIEFICIIWTWEVSRINFSWFLRIEFICIIWTIRILKLIKERSWGLNLFVLFEREEKSHAQRLVLEDWIYLYYLNGDNSGTDWETFLRIEFICIIWTVGAIYTRRRLFLRIEFICIIWTHFYCIVAQCCSWGLNLFVLFELLRLYIKQLRTFLRIEFICIIWTHSIITNSISSSWGLNLFVLFERIG